MSSITSATDPVQVLNGPGKNALVLYIRSGITRTLAMSHPPLRSARLLDQLRERIRYARYSLRTEGTYVYWARHFIRFHNVRHPRDMGAREVEAFLSHLANDRKVAPSTHRQALAAILYLYKEVLDIQLPWMEQIEPTQAARANTGGPACGICARRVCIASSTCSCFQRAMSRSWPARPRSNPLSPEPGRQPHQCPRMHRSPAVFPLRC